jgi:3-phenylpropionate/trans-cinnamate dioxygenase ferredoxin subunit
MPEQRSEFLELLAVDDLEAGTMAARDHPGGGRKLLVARVGDGFYVTQEHCPHMGANLAKGTLEGTVVTCPLHHSRFDVTDGRVVRWTDWEGALQKMGESVRHPRPLQTYEVRVEGGKVLVGPEKPLVGGAS